MNITLDAQYSSSKVTDADMRKTTYSAPTGSTQKYNSGYTLDIADKVTDDKAYQGQGKTMDDIMQQAQNTNVQAQKDFMIVMSNSVSGEDLAKMEKEGFDPKSTDVETYVSIVDKIKVTLAQAGVEIAGYNDNLDKDVVEQITGSSIDVNELCKKFEAADLPITKENIEDILKAAEEMTQVTDMSDDAIKYMLLNKKEPTIENIYLAKFQSATDLKQAKGYFGEEINGYYAKKADTIDFEKIENQMKQVIDESGLPQNEESLENAKWLVLNGIELNTENLTRLSDLKSISLPKNTDEIIDVSITAIENGKRPKDALLIGEESYTQKAKEYIEETNLISDEAIAEVVESGEEINLKNLSQAQKRIMDQNIPKSVNEKIAEPVENISDQKLQELQAKLQLEEIRLMMTIDANKQLLKSGFQIDTVNLQELVEALKQAKEQMQATMFQGENIEENQKRAELFDETINKTREIASMPAAVIGKAIETKDTFTLSYLHKEGTILQTQYDKAGETYEALKTAPRADLGDKITKAFQNVDDILKDLNLEATKENQRAVRILAYNQMEITKENIEDVKHADQAVNRVMNKMTPASTLQMIRDQKNPLEMDMEELEEYLDTQESRGIKETQKFSKYLQKLEHQNNISEDEKKAYMGIYRMFRQIEKSDGAVIGNIVATGAEMNFKNMLSAVRTKANKNIDISIDEEYGSLEKLISKGQAIDQQIMAGYKESRDEANGQNQKQEKYYAKLSGEITKSLAEDISIDSLQKMEITETTTIEKFSDEIENIKEVSPESLAKQETSQIEKKEQDFRRSLQKAQEVEETVLEELITFDQPVSIDNIDAATMLIMERGTLFKQIYGKQRIENDEQQKVSVDTQEEETKDIETITMRMIDKLEDAKTANKAYQEIIDHSYEMVEEKITQNGVTQLDIKAAQALFKGLALAKNLAKEENYEIPMVIKGELTSVNLKIYHDENQKGKVSVTTDTQAFGKVAAEFDITNKKVSGMVVYEKNDTGVIMKDFEKDLNERLKEQEKETGSDRVVSISVAKENTVDLRQFGKNKDMEENHISTKQLYQTAKTFMTVLKELVS